MAAATTKYKKRSQLEASIKQNNTVHKNINTNANEAA